MQVLEHESRLKEKQHEFIQQARAAGEAFKLEEQARLVAAAKARAEGSSSTVAVSSATDIYFSSSGSPCLHS